MDILLVIIIQNIGPKCLYVASQSDLFSYNLCAQTLQRLSPSCKALFYLIKRIFMSNCKWNNENGVINIVYCPILVSLAKQLIFRNENSSPERCQGTGSDARREKTAKILEKKTGSKISEKNTTPVKKILKNANEHLSD